MENLFGRLVSGTTVYCAVGCLNMNGSFVSLSSGLGLSSLLVHTRVSFFLRYSCSLCVMYRLKFMLSIGCISGPIGVMVLSSSWASASFWSTRLHSESVLIPKNVLTACDMWIYWLYKPVFHTGHAQVRSACCVVRHYSYCILQLRKQKE